MLSDLGAEILQRGEILFYKAKLGATKMFPSKLFLKIKSYSIIWLTQLNDSKSMNNIISILF